MENRKPADRQKPKPFTTVQVKRAFEVVTDQVRGQLMSGALRPGDRLPTERELAEQFGLSRNTVREGLRALEVAGLLEFRKGVTGGAFVREGQGEAVVGSFSDLFWLGTITTEQLTEGRLIVGTAVTRLACQRASEDDLDELQANVDAMTAAAAYPDQSERVLLNLEFHRLLARAAKNPVLTILTDALIAVHAKLLETIEPASIKMILPSRRRLLYHLHARDAVAAAKEMEDHLGLLQRHYMQQRAAEVDPARR